MHLKTVNTMIAAGAALAVLPAGAHAQDDFYSGKSVELVVPFSPGGGNDAFARLLQGMFTQCVPEASSFQVVNVPGGGTVIGTNEFELMRPADGTSVLVTSGTTTYAWLLGQQGVRYDPGNWTPVLGLPGGGVIYVDPETGVESPVDLVNTDTEIVFGGITAAGLDLLALLTFEMLEIEPRVIMGYEGKGPARVAFEQGETNIDYQTTPAYVANVQPLVDEGTAVPLYTLGHFEDGDIIRDPAFPDIPSFKEAYVEAMGEEPSGVVWEAYLALISSGVSAQRQVWLHKNSPPEAIEALRSAAQCIVDSEEFYTLGGDILEGYEPIVGEPLERATELMVSVDQGVLDWLRTYISEEHGVEVDN